MDYMYVRVNAVEENGSKCSKVPIPQHTHTNMHKHTRTHITVIHNSRRG